MRFLIVLLTCVSTVLTAAADPVNVVPNGDFAVINEDTHQPNGWVPDTGSKTVARCKADFTPTDNCAYIVKAASRTLLTDTQIRDVNAGDELTLHVTYRTKGAYTLGWARLKIVEHYSIGGTMGVRFKQNRPVKLTRSKEWTTDTSVPLTLIHGQTFDIDTFNASTVWMSVILRNEGAGKLLVDSVEVTVTQPNRSSNTHAIPLKSVSPPAAACSRLVK